LSLSPKLTACILLVESEPLLLRFLRKVLDAAGFKVLAVDNAEAAIEVEKRIGVIDLLLTGVSMPRLSGPRMAEILEAARPGLRVMLMSSNPIALLNGSRSRLVFHRKAIPAVNAFGQYRNCAPVRSVASPNWPFRYALRGTFFDPATWPQSCPSDRGTDTEPTCAHCLRPILRSDRFPAGALERSISTMPDCCGLRQRTYCRWVSGHAAHCG
jgi:CheY-like chemotaxis protein